MSFAIVTDSTCDLTPEEAERYDITVIPLTILLEGKEYRDQVDVTSEEFYDLMDAANELPKTAQPAPFDFAQLYQRLADEGAEHIISLHIAHVLSGTPQAAELGAQQVDVPVTVIDCCGVTCYQGLLAIYAAELRDKGVSAEEAADLIRRAMRRTHFMIAPDTLENLLKGGRLSPLEAKAAGMLNIKPILVFDEEGNLKSADKSRGMRGVVKKMAQAIAEDTAKEGQQRIRFTHTRNQADLDNIKEQLRAQGVAYEDYGTAPCGSVVATHLGMGGIGYASLHVED